MAKTGRGIMNIFGSPRPWRVEETGLEGSMDSGLSIVDANGELVADLYEHEGTHFLNFDNDSENAKLIVAAINGIEAGQNGEG